MQVQPVTDNPRHVIDDGAKAEAELEALRTDVNRCETELSQAQAKRDAATTPKEHTAARDAAEWAATCLKRARDRFTARHAELSPALHAKTIIETRERVLAAHQAYRSYFDRLSQHRADIEGHVLAIVDILAKVRGETQAQWQLAHTANQKVGKLPITERAEGPTTRWAFNFINDRIRQLLDGGTALQFPHE